VVQIAWKQFCDKRGFCEDELFWNDRNRDWKWILQCKKVTISFSVGFIPFRGCFREMKLKMVPDILQVG
jgi:hypothetical protein